MEYFKLQEENECKHSKNSDKMLQKIKWLVEKRAKEYKEQLLRAKHTTINDAENATITACETIDDEKKDAIDINNAKQ